MLDLEEEPQQQQQQQWAVAGMAPADGCTDAAVQTDGERTESAGSTAAAAAAAAAGSEDDAVSPHGQQLRSSGHGSAAAAAGAGASWCEGSAGSALLSAARQEIMRLQELNQQLLHSHAQGRCNVRAQTVAYHVCVCMSYLHLPACTSYCACFAAAQFEMRAN
jgi:hypothetical protein